MFLGFIKSTMSYKDLPIAPAAKEFAFSCEHLKNATAGELAAMHADLLTVRAVISINAKELVAEQARLSSVISPANFAQYSTFTKKLKRVSQLVEAALDMEYLRMPNLGDRMGILPEVDYDALLLSNLDTLERARLDEHRVTVRYLRDAFETTPDGNNVASTWLSYTDKLVELLILKRDNLRRDTPQ